VTGRPPKYETVEDMQTAIDAYFDKCDTEGIPYTLGELAYGIGLSRQGMLEYSRKDAFSDLIKRARERVGAQYERMLVSGKGSTVGLIFTLKNGFGWKDRDDNNLQLNVSRVVYLPSKAPVGGALGYKQGVSDAEYREVDNTNSGGSAEENE